jgi:hypothetical protein
MKKMGLMKVAPIVMAVIVMSMLLPGRAHSWDPATHAYIEEHFYKKQGQLDDGVLYNRIYGANAIDIFNNNFTSPYLEFAAYLHDTTQNNFLKVWEKAGTKAEKAFAYGFVGHNNTWGMDSTAHISGITYGRGEGYVIAKAHVLAVMLKPSLESQLGRELPDDVVVNICHYLVESGVDFLVRSPENAALLIAAAEGQFRYSMMLYGFALTQDNALDLVAEGMAAVGAEYLGMPGSEAALVPVVKQGIFAAMTLCAPDFERELQASTGWVNGKLSSNGISW